MVVFVFVVYAQGPLAYCIEINFILSYDCLNKFMYEIISSSSKIARLLNRRVCMKLIN